MPSATCLNYFTVSGAVMIVNDVFLYFVNTNRRLHLCVSLNILGHINFSVMEKKIPCQENHLTSLLSKAVKNL